MIGIFAALHATLYFLSFGLWRNWAIYLEPIEGIVLGPWAGFSAALIGSISARMIKPADVLIFGIIAEPLGVLTCGFLSKGQWKPVISVYSIMLIAYFLDPLGRDLPLWTILDILLALILIYPVTWISRNIFRERIKHLSIFIVLTSFIGTATDALVRIFLLIPLGVHTFLGWSPEVVSYIFIMGAADSYIEDVFVVIVSSLVGVPLIILLRRILSFRFPLIST
ncbi:MAG: hypothetical protein QG670_1723 [Thermoproteota archaeon]|nr:hypothetical protein [Thermoproteota archaeon]